ncbi:hypothetical protein [Methylobacterium nigriterrae]|uniref:hypothetical protein n=1 Tax=Methylobacterium nigriterrae TaxID=3127512 RepID=UPI003D66EA58
MQDGLLSAGGALRHPIGATGAILAEKAPYALRRTAGRHGLVTMCIGAGLHRRRTGNRPCDRAPAVTPCRVADRASRARAGPVLIGNRRGEGRREAGWPGCLT